jgi:hypothetical protein
MTLLRRFPAPGVAAPSDYGGAEVQFIGLG